MARPDASDAGRASAGAALHRDRQRALHAYEMVAGVQKDRQGDYKIAVNDLGANILRSGLSAAMAELDRQKGGRGGVLLEHLAKAGVSGLDGATRDNLPARMRELDVDSYMLATREMLKVATWLKRAAQATFGDD